MVVAKKLMKRCGNEFFGKFKVVRGNYGDSSELNGRFPIYSCLRCKDDMYRNRENYSPYEKRENCPSCAVLITEKEQVEHPRTTTEYMRAGSDSPAKSYKVTGVHIQEESLLEELTISS